MFIYIFDYLYFFVHVICEDKKSESRHKNPHILSCLIKLLYHRPTSWEPLQHFKDEPLIQRVTYLISLIFGASINFLPLKKNKEQRVSFWSHAWVYWSPASFSSFLPCQKSIYAFFFTYIYNIL